MPSLTNEVREASLTISALWLLAAKTVSFVFSIALPLVLVRKLPISDFGIYKQIFLIIGTMTNLLPLNLGQSAFYFLIKNPERQGSVIANILVFYAAIGSSSALAIIAFPDALAWAFKVPEVANFAAGIAILIPLSILGSFLETALVANREFRLASVLLVFSQLVRTALLVAAVTLGGSISWLLNAAITHGVLHAFILLIYIVRRYPRFWRKGNDPLLRQQFRYSLPFAFSGILWIIRTDFHQYLVSSQFGPAAYAIYSVGCFQLPIIGLLQDSIGSVLIPRVSALAHKGATQEIFLLIVAASRKLALVAFPLYALLIVFGREFLVALFTDQYLASWPVFVINLSLLLIVVVPLDPVFRAYEELGRFLSVVRIGTTVFLLIAISMGSPLFGLPGIIGAVVITTALEQLANSYRAARQLKISISDLVAFRPLLSVAFASAIAATVGELARNILPMQPAAFILAEGSVIIGTTYIFALFALRVLTHEERQIVPSLIYGLSARVGFLQSNRFK